MILQFTNNNYKKEVLQADKLVFVHFSAQWCGPCKMMDPIIEKLSEIYEGKVKIGKVDVDVSPELAKKHGIIAVPTMLLIKKGEVVKNISGARDLSGLQEIINMFA